MPDPKPDLPPGTPPQPEPDNPRPVPPAPSPDLPPDMPPAARRALEEAEARRAARKDERPVEIGGRDGLDPMRYGDYELAGIAVDF